jgi:hypothetical protein
MQAGLTATMTKLTILTADQESTMLMHTALAVLTAYTEHRHPQPADVDLLKKHALPSEADLPIDELACEIVRRELAVRKAAAAAGD